MGIGKHLLSCVVTFSCLCLISAVLHALSVEEIIRLKEAGVEERTIQLLIERETMKAKDTHGMGVQEKERPDGSKDRTYYSVTTPEEEEKSRQQEEEKLKKAYEILRNVIIDQRTR